MDRVELKDFAGGTLQRKFEHSFEKVMENLQDVNTPYKQKREIIIKMRFEQNEARDDVVCETSVTEKLATQASVTTRFAVGKDLRTGEVMAEEYGGAIKGQMELNMAPAENVDQETGEIIDFREAR